MKQKIIGLMEDKLQRKIVTKFVGLRPKIYSYLTDNGCYDKKIKDIKKCLIKWETKFKTYRLSRKKWNKTAEKKIECLCRKAEKKHTQRFVKRQNINNKTTTKVTYGWS